MSQTFLPVLGNQFGFFLQLIYVVSQCQCRYICIQTVNNGTCLFAGAAMRGFNGYLITGLCQPVFAERSVKVLVQLTGWVVRYVE